jgi:hypothetical protein
MSVFIVEAILFTWYILDEFPFCDIWWHSVMLRNNKETGNKCKAKLEYNCSLERDGELYERCDDECRWC